jgi:hypothetical protein
MIDMIVATLTSALFTLPKGLSPLSWLDDLLYLPEVLFLRFFIWLICSGPGRFSVDYWLAGKCPCGRRSNLLRHHFILGGSWLITAAPASHLEDAQKPIHPKLKTTAKALYTGQLV